MYTLVTLLSGLGWHATIVSVCLHLSLSLLIQVGQVLPVWYTCIILEVILQDDKNPDWIHFDLRWSHMMYRLLPQRWVGEDP